MVVEFRVEKHSRHPKPQEIPTANLSDFNLCQVIEPIEGPGSQMCSTKGSGAQDVTCCWWFYPCFIHVSLWPPNIEVIEKAMFSHVYLQKSWGVWCYHWAHRDRSTAKRCCTIWEPVHPLLVNPSPIIDSHNIPFFSMWEFSCHSNSQFQIGNHMESCAFHSPCFPSCPIQVSMDHFHSGCDSPIASPAALSRRAPGLVNMGWAIYASTDSGQAPYKHRLTAARWAIQNDGYESENAENLWIIMTDIWIYIKSYI